MAYNKREKLQTNIEAIRIALTVEKEQREATREERAMLQQYSGFGGLKFILNDIDSDNAIKSWTKSDQPYFEDTKRLYDVIRKFAKDEGERKRLEGSVKRSVNTAFYTPTLVIKAIVKALTANFIKIRNFLDPSSGNGRFVDAFASENTQMKTTAFEKEELTGLILKALHPQDKVMVDGFETIDQQLMGTFDVVSSNIPFGNINVFDPLFLNNAVRQNAAKTIHNYFFLKALDACRDGGLVAFITSRGVADSPQNAKYRGEMMSQANLLSIIRLPDGMFVDDAGTEVGSDLIVLQKNVNKKRNTAYEDLFILSKEHENGIVTNGLFADEGYALSNVIADEVVLGKNMYGEEAYEYRFNSDMSKLAKILQDQLTEDIYQYADKELYNSGLEIGVTKDEVRGIATQVGGFKVGGKRETTQNTTQKVENLQPSVVQLDLFGLWDEQEEQIKKNEPRDFAGKLLSHWRNGTIVEDNGQIGMLSDVYPEHAMFNPGEYNARQEGVLRQYIKIRDAYRVLFDTEADTLKEQPELREALNKSYDAFVRQYGAMPNYYW